MEECLWMFPERLRCGGNTGGVIPWVGAETDGKVEVIPTPAFLAGM